jgi:hypothetical protein
MSSAPRTRVILLAAASAALLAACAQDGPTAAPPGKPGRSYTVPRDTATSPDTAWSPIRR